MKQLLSIRCNFERVTLKSKVEDIDDSRWRLSASFVDMRTCAENGSRLFGDHFMTDERTDGRTNYVLLLLLLLLLGIYNAYTY